MSDEKRYTERDLVLAQRVGYVTCRVEHGYLDKAARSVYERQAAQKYPLPTRTVPRVVMSEPDDLAWRCVCGQIEYRIGNKWRRADGEHSVAVTPERVALWADLLAHPTEEVEDV